MADDSTTLKEIHQTLKNIEKILFCFLGLTILFIIEYSTYGPLLAIIILAIIIPLIIFRLPVKNRYERAEADYETSV